MKISKYEKKEWEKYQLSKYVNTGKGSGRRKAIKLGVWHGVIGILPRAHSDRSGYKKYNENTKCKSTDGKSKCINTKYTLKCHTVYYNNHP